MGEILPYHHIFNCIHVYLNLGHQDLNSITVFVNTLLTFKVFIVMEVNFQRVFKHSNLLVIKIINHTNLCFNEMRIDVTIDIAISLPYAYYLCVITYTFIYIYIYTQHKLSIYLSIYLSVCLSVCLPACLSVCLSIYLSIFLSIYLSLYM